ncbi:MAG: hypothetical protein K6B46_06585 [Opitutales bacterium]|nr:hypothetical protein [Opitutales bacterium]
MSRFFIYLFSFLFASVLALAAPKKGVSAPDDDADDAFEDVIEELPGDNFLNSWPTETKLAEKLPAKTVKDGPDEWVYETKHFQFHSNAPIAISTIKQIATIFEGTYVANLSLPLNAPCNYYQVAESGKYQAQLYETMEQYKASGAPDGSAGYYRGNGDLSAGKTHVPFQSLGLEKAGKKYVRGGRKVDSKTLVHEITHHMTLGSWTIPAPLWYKEGYAEYVGCSPYNNGRINFKNNVKGLAAQLSNRLSGQKVFMAPMTLKAFMRQSDGEFMSRDNVQFNYGMSMALFYYFCHCDGKRDAAKLKSYIKALQEGETPEKAEERLLAGRSWNAFQKEVSKAIKSKLKITITFPNEK